MRKGILVDKYILSKSCVEILTLAIEKVQQLRQSYIMPVHFFLAILNFLNLNVRFVKDMKKFLVRLFQILNDRLFEFEKVSYFFTKTNLKKPRKPGPIVAYLPFLYRFLVVIAKKFPHFFPVHYISLIRRLAYEKNFGEINETSLNRWVYHYNVIHDKKKFELGGLSIRRRISQFFGQANQFLWKTFIYGYPLTYIAGVGLVILASLFWGDLLEYLVSIIPPEFWLKPYGDGGASLPGKAKNKKALALNSLSFFSLIFAVPLISISVRLNRGRTLQCNGYYLEWGDADLYQQIPKGFQLPLPKVYGVIEPFTLYRSKNKPVALDPTSVLILETARKKVEGIPPFEPIWYKKKYTPAFYNDPDRPQIDLKHLIYGLFNTKSSSIAPILQFCKMNI